jgi:c-di-GMP-binding flagellar brake protein YcgR
MPEATKKPAIHDEVHVEAEVDGNVVGLRAIVVSVLPTSLWLGLTQPNTSLKRFQPDQTVNLTIRRGTSAMVAESRFLSHLGASKSRLFSVEWPEDFRVTQRREHLRLDAECPIEYTVIRQGDSGAAGRTGEGITCNLGAGGLQFKVHFPPGEDLMVDDELWLRVALGADAVAAEGKVVRIEPVPAPLHGKPKAGSAGAGAADPGKLVAVRFIAIGVGTQDRIVRYIFRLQRVRRDKPRRRG